MFIVVKCSSNNELLVNTNSRVINVLRYVQRQGNVDPRIELDIADVHGEVKHLHENKDAYAYNFVREREKYILLKIERKAGEAKPTYVPLFSDDKLITEEFKNKLNSVKKSKTSSHYTKTLKSNLKPTSSSSGPSTGTKKRSSNGVIINEPPSTSSLDNSPLPTDKDA